VWAMGAKLVCSGYCVHTAAKYTLVRALYSQNYDITCLASGLCLKFRVRHKTVMSSMFPPKSSRHKREWVRDLPAQVKEDWDEMGLVRPPVKKDGTVVRCKSLLESVSIHSYWHCIGSIQIKPHTIH